MTVLWALAAEQDRVDIIEHIGNDNPLAAIHMDELFSEAAEQLAHQNPAGSRTLARGPAAQRRRVVAGRVARAP